MLALSYYRMFCNAADIVRELFHMPTIYRISQRAHFPPSLKLKTSILIYEKFLLRLLGMIEKLPSARGYT